METLLLFLLIIVIAIVLYYFTGKSDIMATGFVRGGRSRRAAKTDEKKSKQEKTVEQNDNLKSTSRVTPTFDPFAGGIGEYRTAAQITSDVYNYTKSTIEQTGTDNIVKYLVDVFQSGDPTKLSYNTVGIPENHRTYYSLLNFCVEKCRAKNYDDFVIKSGLAYRQFLDNSQKQMLDATIQAPSPPSLRGDFKRILETRILEASTGLYGSSYVPAQKLEETTDEFFYRARSFVRWIGPLPDTPEKAASMMQEGKFELDTVGVINVVRPLVTALRGDAEKPVAEILRSIDLVTMRNKDPSAVRDFIDRMRRDIKYYDEQELRNTTWPSPRNTIYLADTLLNTAALRHQREESERLRLENERLNASLRARAASPPPTASFATPSPPPPPSMSVGTSYTSPSPKPTTMQVGTSYTSPKLQEIIKSQGKGIKSSPF